MAVIRIRPKKPHFFKPILPASYQHLEMPKAFLKYLVGEDCEEGEAKLINHGLCGKSWPVKLKGFCFQEGWTDFVQDNDLQLGDFVVFGYEGSMVFDVIVFDRSFCEKKFPPLHVKKKAQIKSDSCPLGRRVMTRSKGENEANRSKLRPSFAVSLRGFKLKKTTKCVTSPSRRVTTRWKGQKADKAADQTKAHPSFAVTVKKFNLKKTTLYIPHRFAKSNGLMGKRYEVILRDQMGRPWPVNLKRRPCDDRMYICGGWLDFSYANQLKEEDVCVFKLNSQGKGGGKMVFDVKVFNSNDPRAADEMKKHNQIEPGPRIPFFVTSLKQYNFNEFRLGIPMEVVRSNGLTEITFETILRDGNGNSWQVKLKHKRNGQTFISGNWKEISASNGLKLGDACSLELIQKKGKMKPVEFLMH